MTEETHNITTDHRQSELKQVLGALLFASRKPITMDELRTVLAQVDQNGKDATHLFGKIRESDIRMALKQIETEIAERKLGIIIVEVAGGFRFQTDPAGGPWVRQLLNLDKPARLSKPALETLAIIAYRQPVTRAEIEALRGVNVDAMMRHLLELQLIRIMGRSDLPGRPLMYGTTQLFLEHFGLSSVKNLPGVEQLSRRDAERVQRESEDGPALRSLGEAGTTDPPTPERFGGQAPDAGPEKTEDDLPADLSTDMSGGVPTSRRVGTKTEVYPPTAAPKATRALAKEAAPNEVEGTKAGQQTAENGSAKDTNDEDDDEENNENEEDEDEDEGRK